MCRHRPYMYFRISIKNTKNVIVFNTEIATTSIFYKAAVNGLINFMLSFSARVLAVKGHRSSYIFSINSSAKASAVKGHN